MPTVREFVTDFATAVAAIATTRDATQTFTQHKGHTAFKASAIAGRDGFQVEIESFSTSEAWGIGGQKHTEVFLRLELGHAPFATDETRKTLIASDVERLMDLLEAKANWSAGAGGSVGFVGLEPGWKTDESDDSWWLTSLTFRCQVFGPIATV